MRCSFIGLIAAVGAAAATAVLAHSSPEIVYRGHSVYVSQPWARATPPMAKNGAVYMTIINSGDATDRLLGAATPVAESTALHLSSTEGAIAKMKHVEAADIPVNVLFELKPGGLHVMLLGLKGPLKEGESFPMTLRFEKGGVLKVNVIVEKMGTQDASHDATNIPQHRH